MLTKEKKLEKRKDIAKSTCDLFVQKGFVNISVSEIAKVAGIGKGTVYEYFANKEDIVFELMSCLQEDYDPKLKENLQNSHNAKEKLQHLFSLYLSDDVTVQTQRDIYREFLAITLNNPSEAIIEYQDNMMAKYYQILTDIFQESIDRNELKEESLNLIPGIFATMDGFFIARKSRSEMKNYIDSLFIFLETRELE